MGKGQRIRALKMRHSNSASHKEPASFAPITVADEYTQGPATRRDYGSMTEFVGHRALLDRGPHLHDQAAPQTEASRGLGNAGSSIGFFGLVFLVLTFGALITWIGRSLALERVKAGKARPGDKQMIAQFFQENPDAIHKEAAKMAKRYDFRGARNFVLFMRDAKQLSSKQLQNCLRKIDALENENKDRSTYDRSVHRMKQVGSLPNLMTDEQASKTGTQITDVNPATGSYSKVKHVPGTLSSTQIANDVENTGKEPGTSSEVFDRDREMKAQREAKSTKPSHSGSGQQLPEVIEAQDSILENSPLSSPHHLISGRNSRERAGQGIAGHFSAGNLQTGMRSDQQHPPISDGSEEIHPMHQVDESHHL